MFAEKPESKHQITLHHLVFHEQLYCSFASQRAEIYFGNTFPALLAIKLAA